MRIKASASISESTSLYQIRLKGILSDQWSDWFDGMSLRSDAEGSTILTGPVADQAALYGLLDKTRDLGLTLISVTRLTP
jgi:hypothetical protein